MQLQWVSRHPEENPGLALLRGTSSVPHPYHLHTHCKVSNAGTWLMRMSVISTGECV